VGALIVRGEIGPVLDIISDCRTRRLAVAYLLHHVTVTIMVTVTTSTAERVVEGEGKGCEERIMRREG
jgi:hypothetical protein